MPQFDIGKYSYTTDPTENYYNLSLILPEPAGLVDSIRSYDHMLHQSLDKIFCERGLSSNSQIQEFIRGPQLKSLIEPILEQEPILSKHFSKEKFGKLSLFWIAVLVGYEKSAELLVRSGADVNEPFGRHDPQVIYEKWTVLHVLLQMHPSPENERLIRLILDRNADLEVRDSQGQTVMQYAVMESRVQIIEILLEKGADINAADDAGWTPLLDAVSGSGKANELVPLLMKHGADIFVKNNDGENVLHHLSYYPDSGHAVNLARVLIEKGVPVDDGDNLDHCQHIHLAAIYGRNELIKLYLDHGANVNALTNEGRSPLHYAASGSNVTVVETLLERGANIHLKTTKDRTALHAVCTKTWLLSPTLDYINNSKSIIRRLLSAGADVLAEDCDGNTPLALISSGEDRQQPGQVTWPLIEALALKKALQPSIELKDEMIIERYQNLRDYYQKCTGEIGRMKSTRFIDCCTFFELFAKSRCQIAALMRNPEFEVKFRLYDLNNEFLIYYDDIRQAFERTLKHHHSLLEQEHVINEAVYRILPYLVIKKVVHYALNCCENVE